ncbi:MAG: hypothetical protein WCO96_07795 [Actinomycetes bacterium]
MSDVASALADTIAADDPLLAAAVAERPALADGHPADAARGPRAASDPEAYRFALEAIHEGHLLHNGGGRLVVTDDLDLRLLAGDRLYAEGLERVAALDDVEAIVELSRLIVRCSVAKADLEPEAADSAWAEACSVIGGLA